MTSSADRSNCSLQVSCVVVAFHRPVALGRLLDALVHDLVEVVVVNVERDPEMSAVVTAGGPGVRELGLVGNPGFGAGVNRGAAVASGPVVVFMNDDLVVSAETVLALATVVMEGGADVAVPRLVTKDGKSERTIMALPSLGSLAWEWMLLPDQPVPVLRRFLPVQKWRLPQEAEPVGAASAAVVAVSATLLRSVPLPEEYFLYWEENEWFWSLRQRGARVQYRPELIARHDGGRADVRPDKSKLMARNSVRCMRATQGELVSWVSIGVVVVWNLRLVLTDLGRALMAPRSEAAGRLPARLAGLIAAFGAGRATR